MSKRKTSNEKPANTNSKPAKKASTAKSGTRTTKSASASSKRTTLGTKTNKPAAKKLNTKSKAGKVITAEQRNKMIEEAAYFYSIEGDADNCMENWLRAERDIDRQLNMTS